MDLRFPAAVETPAERDAIDAVLGSPAGSWDGGERSSAQDGHFARGGHEARSRRHLLLPALHAASARVGACASWASNLSVTAVRSASSTHCQMSPHCAACSAGSLSPSSESPKARALPTRRGRK